MGLGRGKGGRGAPLSQQQTILSAIRVQTSNYGGAMPLVYGQQRVSGKLLDYQDFTPIAHVSQQQTGGKGGGGGQTTTTTTYTYTAACVIALCEGPVATLKNVWDTKGKLSLVSGSSTYVIAGTTYTPPVPDSGAYYADEGVGYNQDYDFNAADYGSDGSRRYYGTHKVPMRRVASAPAAGQYAVNSDGTYTFHASDVGKTAVLNYVYSVPDSSGDAAAPPTKLSLSLFPGDRGQAPWGYMASRHADRAIGYSGTAYVASSAFDLGSSGSLPNFSYEVQGLLSFGAGIVDANPKDVVQDIIVNPFHGTTFPVANLGDLTQYSNYCVANGLFLSPVIDAQSSAADLIDHLTKLTNTGVVWSEGKLKFIPYGDTTAVGNGAIFTPSTTPVYDLTDADFICDKDSEPLTVSIVPPEEQFNVCKLEILNRANAYNPLPIEDKDDAAIQVNGLRAADVLQAHEICDPAVGKQVAMFLNRRSAYITRKFQFKLGLKYILLEPMDLVTLTDARLGLDKYPVRILSIDEDEDGFLSIEAEEFPWGTSTATAYPAQAPNSYSPNTGVDPGNVNTPIIFEATDKLSQFRGNEVWIAVSGSDPDWGGCSVWASADGNSYKKVGAITAPARMGVLTTSLADGNGATTQSFGVDLTQSRGQLSSGSQDDCDNFRTLCWVDGELISFQSATLTAPYQYTLGTRLQRGAYGSAHKAHNSGTQVTRVDDALFHFNYDPTWAGKTAYLKFTSFNVFGGGEQSLGSVPAYLFTVPGLNKGAYDQGTGLLIDASLGVVSTAVNLAQQAANDAADAAATAESNAAAAKTAADNATAALAIISSDGWISKGEKAAVALDKANIDAEYSDIVAKANSLAVSVTAYQNAKTALDTYLGRTYAAGGVGAGGSDWSNSTTDSQVVAADWKSNWSLYYSTRQSLLNAISAELKNRAENSAVTATRVAFQTGGENLCFNGNAEKGLTGFALYNNGNNAGSTLTAGTGGVYGGATLRVSFSTANNTMGVHGSNAQGGGILGGWSANTTYMLSFYAKASGSAVGKTMETAWNTWPTVTAVLNPPLTTSFQRYVFKLAWGASVEADGHLYLTIATTNLPLAAAGTLDFDGIQVEQGDLASLWKPCSREINADVVTAQASATSALNQLSDIASDNYLTPGEKPAVITDYNTLLNEQAGIDAQATNFGITTEKTAYDNALSALTSYLAGLTSPVLWSNLSDKTAIVGTTFRSKFTDAYGARQTLLNKVASIAKSLADAAAVSAGTTLYVKGTGFNNSANRVVKLGTTDITVSPQGRGLQCVIIRRSDLAVTSNTVYDVYSSQTDRQNLAALLNATTSASLVVLASFDAINFADGLAAAVNACGGYVQDTGTSGAWGGRLPYALVGIGGIGTGGGMQVSTNVATSTPFAEISTSLRNGTPDGMGTIGSAAINLANSAASTAAAAQTAANNAMSALNNMASDSVLTKQEKPAIIQQWGEICTEKLGLQNTADGYGISSTAYVNAYNNLATYLGSLSPAWNDKTQDTTIDPTTWANTWAAYYNEKQAILTAAADNWNFEASTTLPPPGWSASNPSYVTLGYETSNPQSGTQSLKVVSTGIYQGALANRVWKVQPGDKFKVSAYMYGDGREGSAHVQLAFLDAAGTWLGAIELGSAASAWTKVTSSNNVNSTAFAMPAPAGTATARLTAGSWIAGGSTSYYDQIRVTKIASDSDVFLDTSTGLNGQGSMAPQLITCSGSLTGLLVSSAPRIRFTFTPGVIYMPDGTVYSVSASTQDFSTWAGQALAYYTAYNGNIRFKVATSTVDIQQFSGVSTAASKAEAYRDGYIPINYGINVTTPDSGGYGGGGGGGTGCFSGNTRVQVAGGHLSMAEIEQAGGYTVVRTKFGDRDARLLVHEEATREMIDMGEGQLVTLDHLIFDSAKKFPVPASEYFADRPRVSFTGKVYNLAVDGRYAWEHWYILENGAIASNQKANPN